MEYVQQEIEKLFWGHSKGSPNPQVRPLSSLKNRVENNFQEMVTVSAPSAAAGLWSLDV
jgi:hypothetical protein